MHCLYSLIPLLAPCLNVLITNFVIQLLLITSPFRMCMPFKPGIITGENRGLGINYLLVLCSESIRSLMMGSFIFLFNKSAKVYIIDEACSVEKYSLCGIALMKRSISPSTFGDTCNGAYLALNVSRSSLPLILGLIEMSTILPSFKLVNSCITGGICIRILFVSFTTNSAIIR